MIRAPRKGFWHDQARAAVVGLAMVIVLIELLTLSGVPHDIESKIMDAPTHQGG